GLLHGNLGSSIVTPGKTVAEAIAQTLPWTLMTVGIGTILGFVLGIVVGALLAWRSGGIADKSVGTVASILQSTPNYVWAMIVILILGVQLELVNIVKMRGTLSPGIEVGLNYATVRSALYHG